MRRYWGAVAGGFVALLMMATFSVGCSAILDLQECGSDSDCIPEKPVCDDGVCVER